MYNVAIQYNPDNSTLYFLDINNIKSGGSMYVYSYDLNNEYLKKYPIGIREKSIFLILYIYPKMVLNTNTNQLCIPGGDHSKVIVLDNNFEQKRIEPKIDWVSFPRLNRTGNNAVDGTDFFETMRRRPYSFKAQHKEEYSKATINETIWNWSDTILDEIISSKGYKLETHFNENPLEGAHFAIWGTRLDPNTSMTISNAEENWLGYFLPYPCHVKDAFRKCWDKIKIIKTQDWSMVRLAPGTPFLSYPQDPYLYDADMVIVEMFESVTFEWDAPTIPILPSQTQHPQYFHYTEEMDYVPVVVELDPNDPADEIGVFVNGECQGASVVTGSVTTINAYILDSISHGEPIEIRTWTSSKDGGKTNVHKQYFVYNPETGTSSKSILVKNDNWPFYYLPLKKVNTVIPELNQKVNVSIHPNPTTGLVSYSIKNRLEDKVTITLHDATGKLVSVINSGFIATGNNSGSFNIDKYTKAKGLFYLSFTGNTIQATEKIIVL